MLAQPRGFCAGVIRAIDIVEQALTKFGVRTNKLKHPTAEKQAAMRSKRRTSGSRNRTPGPYN